MKKILLVLFVLFCVILNMQGQVPADVTSIWPKYNLDARPLENKTHEYTIGLSSGSSAYISVTCENGVFEINNSTSYGCIASNSFSLKVKWGKAGVGRITAVGSGNYKATYQVNIEKPQVSISGPVTVKFEDYAEYKLSFNPNMTIKSLTWGNSSDFESISGQNELTYKVRLIKNTSKTVDNAIFVAAKTDYGDMSAGLSVTLKPVFTIKPNQTFVCNNNDVTYSIISIDGATINWQSTPTMTLISGQGTTTATYKSEGNMTGGYETVNAIVTYAGNDYTVTNSNVWVGSPGTPRIEGLMIGDYEPGSYYRLMAISPYSDSYSWIANGAAQIVPDITVQPLSAGSLKAIKDLPPMVANSIMTLVTDNINPPRIAQFTLSVKSWNKCGVSPEFSTNGTIVSRYNYLLKDGNKESIEKITSLQPSSPVSIKVYTFNTGTLVYSEKNVIDFNIQNTTLKDGIYVVVTTDQNGETKSEKVVKTRN